MIRFLGILLLIALVVAGAFFWEDANFAAAGPLAAKGASETDIMIKPRLPFISPCMLPHISSHAPFRSSPRSSRG